MLLYALCNLQQVGILIFLDSMRALFLHTKHKACLIIESTYFKIIFTPHNISKAYLFTFKNQLSFPISFPLSHFAYFLLTEKIKSIR